MFFDYEECTWKEMTFAIGGAIVKKIRDVRYSIESDDEALYAAGDEPLDIQSGNKKYTGTFKLLKGALDDLQKAAKAAGASDITGIRFDIVVSYIAAGSRKIQIDTLGGCKISKFEKGWAQGAKYMEVDIPFNFLKLVTVE